MKSERKSWILQRRLLQHAIRQEKFVLEGKVDPKGMEWTLDMLGLLWSVQGKLAEAEAMYTRALQGYEHALCPELLPSYLPALGTMFAFGDLFSRTGRKDLAKVMYSWALARYTTAQGPSSKWCRRLEDRLQALQVASAESKVAKMGLQSLE